MENGITPQINSATRVRLLMADIVAMSKLCACDASSSCQEQVAMRLDVGQKAIDLVVELFESHVGDEASDANNQFPDSDGLGYLRFRDSEVIGWVDHVNGSDAKVCPEYSPTHHELKQLAKYWIERILDLDFYWHQTQCTGSSEWREREFAARRLSRLSNALGHKQITELEADVCDTLRDRFGAELWDSFAGQRAESSDHASV